MVGHDDDGRGGNVDVADPRVVLHQSAVPETRFDRDGSRLHAPKVVDHALELNAFGCALVAALGILNT